MTGLESEEDLNKLRNAGEAAIQDEFDTYNSMVKDEHGWTDLKWLHYLRHDKAKERKPDEMNPKGLTIDRGHQGMNLDAFTQLPQAVAAGLKRAHVLAIRLYTSPVFQNISKPLHDGCSPTRPHPYPALVALLTEALKKVRTEQLNRERTNPDELLPHRVLWRGVSKLGDGTSEFKQRGGTEISPMSNSFDRKVAETRALQEYITQRALEASTPKSPNASELSTPTLLKLRIDNFAAAGVDVSKFSVLPDEGEGESEEQPPNPHRASLLPSLSPLPIP